MALLTQNKAKICKTLIIKLVFEKNAIFSPKIVKNRRNRPQFDEKLSEKAPNFVKKPPKNGTLRN
jgi:hypothetical protein